MGMFMGSGRFVGYSEITPLWPFRSYFRVLHGSATHTCMDETHPEPMSFDGVGG